MSQTDKFRITIFGKECASAKRNFKCWGAFAEAFLYGINDLLDEKIKEYFHVAFNPQYSCNKGFYVKTMPRISHNWESRISRNWEFSCYLKHEESLVIFRRRVKLEIYDWIINEIKFWWNADPEPTKEYFDPLALPGNIFGPYNPVLIKWPTFSVSFGNYGKDFVRDKRLEDIDFFILWMTMEIPGLARIAKEQAIINFNNGDKSLTFSHGRLPFKAEPDRTAEEFGESVRLQVRQILYSYVNNDLRAELEEEEAYPWIDAEVDPNMFADVPNDDEARYAELLASPPKWFLADETE